LTGTQFTRQLPVEMQAPRFARGSMSWEF